MAAFENVAVVTGAGSGIGRPVALALLKNGYAVSLAGTRADRRRQTIAEVGVPESRALEHDSFRLKHSQRF